MVEMMEEVLHILLLVWSLSNLVRHNLSKTKRKEGKGLDKERFYQVRQEGLTRKWWEVTGDSCGITANNTREAVERRRRNFILKRQHLHLRHSCSPLRLHFTTKNQAVEESIVSKGRLMKSVPAWCSGSCHYLYSSYGILPLSPYFGLNLTSKPAYSPTQLVAFDQLESKAHDKYSSQLFSVAVTMIRGVTAVVVNCVAAFLPTLWIIQYGRERAISSETSYHQRWGRGHWVPQ